MGWGCGGRGGGGLWGKTNLVADGFRLGADVQERLINSALWLYPSVDSATLDRSNGAALL